MRSAVTLLVLILGPASWALGQSSSLFLRNQARRAAAAEAATQPAANGALRSDAGAAVPANGNRNVAVAQTSLTAVNPPEPKLIKVNDLVGVIVRYRLRHQSTSKMKQDDKWDAHTKLDAWFRIHDHKWQQQAFQGGTPEVTLKNKSLMDNKSEANRNDLLETRLMAKVIDVKPNGNLVLVAWSRMEIDDELQYLRMTGECHRDQMTPDGTITSDRIFGLEVRTMNEGAVKDGVKRGWFKELSDTVKPF